jgi:hypothetical protein
MINDDEFYVGYAPRPPARLRTILLRTVLGIDIGLVVLAAILVINQKPFAPSAFEFGLRRDFRGIVEERPYPALLVARPGAAAAVGEFPFSRYLLVAPGKHGATAAVAGLDGRDVSLQGSLIYRHGDTAIELAPGFEPLAHGAASLLPRGSVELGMVTLAGEIVDSKCYLGVMNPGNGKVHRDCAVRCISGGIPPAFAVTDTEGHARVLLLAGADGCQLNREVLNFVAEPITIFGRLTRSGDTYILWAEPSSFRRVE